MDWQELLDRAEEAFVSGNHHDALQLCDRAAVQNEDARYYAALMRGDLLLDLGDAAGALSSYDSAADPSIPDPALDAARGVALFELCRFAEAENALASALRGDESLADAHYTLALIAEITGTGRDVEHFRQARRLAPERFPPTFQMARADFEAVVEEALTSLPVPIRDAVENVPILIAEVPQLGELLQAEPAISPRVLGLFVGIPPSQTSVLDEPVDTQPTILLFKRNLERAAPTRNLLVDEIRVTVLHEIGHALGLTEEQLEALELG